MKWRQIITTITIVQWRSAFAKHQNCIAISNWYQWMTSWKSIASQASINVFVVCFLFFCINCNGVTAICFLLLLHLIAAYLCLQLYGSTVTDYLMRVFQWYNGVLSNLRLIGNWFACGNIIYCICNGWIAIGSN